MNTRSFHFGDTVRRIPDGAIGKVTIVEERRVGVKFNPRATLSAWVPAAKLELVEANKNADD